MPDSFKRNTLELKLAHNLLLSLAIFGLLVSLYLLYLYSQPSPVVCLGYDSCEVVKNSKYSSFLGVKLPIWGSLYFVFLVAYLGFNYLDTKIRDNYYLFLGIVITFGFVFELCFTIIQMFVISALCFWCLCVGLATLTLFLVFWLYVWPNIRHKFSFQQ